MVAKIISLIGASGNVGRITLSLLVQAFGPEKLRIAGSPSSIGNQLNIAGCTFTLENLNHWTWTPGDIVIFNTESDISAHYIPSLVNKSLYIVDSSSYYRMSENLIVPGVNLDQIMTKPGQIFSHANCIVSPIAQTLKPILDLVPIENLIISTYQSSSGAGKKAQDELLTASNVFMNTGKHLASDYFPKPLPFNIIPQIGEFNDTGSSSEEVKIKQELQKLLGDFQIMATAVRVPSLIGHASSLTIQLKSALHKEEIISSLVANNITVVESYITPIEVIGSNQVFVGRIRQDRNWLQLWVVSDNLMVGAAYDSFVITQALLNKSI